MCPTTQAKEQSPSEAGKQAAAISKLRGRDALRHCEAREQVCRQPRDYARSLRKCHVSLTWAHKEHSDNGTAGACCRSCPLDVTTRTSSFPTPRASAIRPMSHAELAPWSTSMVAMGSPAVLKHSTDAPFAVMLTIFFGRAGASKSSNRSSVSRLFSTAVSKSHRSSSAITSAMPGVAPLSRAICAADVHVFARIPSFFCSGSCLCSSPPHPVRLSQCVNRVSVMTPLLHIHWITARMPEACSAWRNTAHKGDTLVYPPAGIVICCMKYFGDKLSK
mmetsp:Transcript_130932/g.326668  ORF Transcript_130932/g.326668 Transcript_130932/m.326668 type:complete len:276 (+) Transcript_130932:228-1055(+)